MLVYIVISRSITIKRGEAEFDSDIPRDDNIHCHTQKNVIFILLYRTIYLNLLNVHKLNINIPADKNT